MSAPTASAGSPPLIRDVASNADHYISQGVDINKQDAERLDHQHHDLLTGLPNRALFDRTLAEALERQSESNASPSCSPTSTTSRS